MTESSHNKEKLEELFRIVAAPLLAEAPSGWRELRQTVLEAGKSGQQVSHAVMADGSKIPLKSGSFEDHDALLEIRSMLYRSGKGAWYTARLCVKSDGKVTMDFDYDSEPEWRSPKVAATYVEDLEMFPRDLEHQPEWLREKLRQASA